MVNKMTKEEQEIERDNYVKEQVALFAKYGIEEAAVPENEDDKFGYYSNHLDYLEIKSPEKWDKLDDVHFGLGCWRIYI